MSNIQYLKTSFLFSLFMVTPSFLFQRPSRVNSSSLKFVIVIVSNCSPTETLDSNRATNPKPFPKIFESLLHSFCNTSCFSNTSSSLYFHVVVEFLQQLGMKMCQYRKNKLQIDLLRCFTIRVLLTDLVSIPLTRLLSQVFCLK